MNKESYVAFISKKLKAEFESLEQGKFEDKQLYKFIDNARDILKQNPKAGKKIPKKLWPKVYIQKHNITNLRKYNMPNGWRLVYTIEAEEVTILSIILEWFDHKEYEKRFKY